MGSLNQIKSKLKELEGGVFHRLCEEWLNRRGFENINSIGMMDVTDRVVKGTPDSLLMQEDGNFIFSEHTIQQSQLAKKLEDDINKCLDESKTDIPVHKISKIILCYLGKLSTKEICRLKDMCTMRDISLELNSLDVISMSIKNRYPILSEEYLGLPLDTGQLLSIDDFVTQYSNSNFTTSIDNQMLFRNDLIKGAVKRLESTKCLIVSGSAGLGKTLFSINLALKMKEDNYNLKALCLLDKGIDIYRDITASLSEPGDYLIFIDDANRLGTRLDYILHYLLKNDTERTYRIIATVRDYARKDLMDRVNRFVNYQEIIIQSLTNEEIKDLSEKLFGVKNEKYHKVIQDISCGNPRLAMMASKIAVESNQIHSIRNATSLYNDYFGENEVVKKTIDDKTLILSAGVISFFRKVDKKNEIQMQMIEDSFGIQCENFWEYVSELNRYEIVDLYENEVVKISDQILATYLLYIVIFEKKLIPFSKIINDFFPKYKSMIVDALNPIIKAFDQEKIVVEIRKEIKKIFNIYSTGKSKEAALEFLNTFWFALPTEALLFVSNTIKDIPSTTVDWRLEDFDTVKESTRDSLIIKLLINFRSYKESDFKISLDLLLKYLEKDKSSIGNVIKVLTETYNFEYDDWQVAYKVQNTVLDKLIGLMDKGSNYLYSRLFLLVASSFLKVEHRNIRTSGRDEVTLTTINLTPNEYLISLRKKIFNEFISLFNNLEYQILILEFFNVYIKEMKKDDGKMVESDFITLCQILPKICDNADINHCLIVHDYCDLLDFFSIDYPKQWREVYSNDTVELLDLLTEDRNERYLLKLGVEEYKQFWHNKIVEYFDDVSIPTFRRFLNRCKELHSILSVRDRNCSLQMGLQMSLNALAELNSELYPTLISEYLNYDDQFTLNPNQIVCYLLNNYSHELVYSLLHSTEYRYKNYWLSHYFAHLPKEFVDSEKTSLLIEHLSTIPCDENYRWLDYLEKYKVYDKNIYRKVVTILLERTKEDDQFYSSPLVDIFNVNSKIFGKWFDEFKPENDLVFNAYLKALKIDNIVDYSGDVLKLLVDKRFDFLFRYVDHINAREKNDYSHSYTPKLSFLWERENYVDEIGKLGKYILEKNECSYYDQNLFSDLFTKERGSNESNDTRKRKQVFLKHEIRNNAHNISYILLLFNSTSHFPREFRQGMVSLFISANSSFEDFKRIEYELTARWWSGSRVPILEQEIVFLESLLPLFETFDYLNHKLYVEQKIEEKSTLMEDAKKWDYLES